MKKVIFVIGPPRSGTSAVSHVIHKLGVDFGSFDRFVDPEIYTHNPVFFELQSLNELNDEIFKYFSKTYSKFDWMPELGDFSHDVIHKFENKIFKFIKEEFSGSNIIGLKDPRFCFTLPIWSAVLKRLGFQVNCVLTRRMSNSVFTSNMLLNQLPPAVNFRLVTQSQLLAREFVEAESYLVVRYEELMADPRSSIASLCD